MYLHSECNLGISHILNMVAGKLSCCKASNALSASSSSSRTKRSLGCSSAVAVDVRVDMLVVKIRRTRCGCSKWNSRWSNLSSRSWRDVNTGGFDIRNRLGIETTTMRLGVNRTNLEGGRRGPNHRHVNIAATSIAAYKRWPSHLKIDEVLPQVQLQSNQCHSAHKPGHQTLDEPSARVL